MSDSLLNDATGLVRQLLGQSRYRLDVHGCTEFLDVLKFSSVETLSQPWRFDISVTSSSPDIAGDAVLLKPASFTFQTPVFDGTPAMPVRTVYGMVESFKRVSTSKEDTVYTLALVPRIALLAKTKRCEIFLNHSVTDVVEKVLRRHGLEGRTLSFVCPVNTQPES